MVKDIDLLFLKYCLIVKNKDWYEICLFLFVVPSVIFTNIINSYCMAIYWVINF